MAKKRTKAKDAATERLDTEWSLDFFYEKLAVKLITACSDGAVDLTVREIVDILDLASESAAEMIAFHDT